MITVSAVVENMFCEKFTYYDQVLGIPQYEETRGTIISGRSLHKRHELTNQTFIPKNLQGKKIIARKFYSKVYDYVGIIDEAIDLGEEIILIERKFSNYVRIYDTLKVQLGLLSILIEENLNKVVNKAYVIFNKDNREEIIVNIDKSIVDLAITALNRTKQIINSGIMPESVFDNRCLNCCYRKICPVGTLNID